MSDLVYWPAIIDGSRNAEPGMANDGGGMMTGSGGSPLPRGGTEPAHNGIQHIDLGFMGTDGVIAAYLLVGDDELGLIETGPSSTRSGLEAGIQALGYRLGDVSRIVVTHIHFDHAGAAGSILRDFPEARLSVHPVGLPHLVDPSRLISSATRIYGDRMDELWGAIVPAPESRVDALRDGETVRVGGRQLRTIFTPGHAAHHAALFDESSGTLFSGDVGGVRIQGTAFVSPPTPPPELDRDAWRSSIRAMRDLRASRLALSHFGFFDDVDAHFDRLERALDDVTRFARETLTADSDTALLTERLLEYARRGGGSSLTDATMRQVELANPAFMGALGLQRYLRKRGELG